MRVLLTGLNHKTAPLDVREKVAFSKDQLSEALPLLAERVGQAVVLSTCNRTEVYAVADEPADTTEEVRRFVAGYHGLDPAVLAPHMYDLVDTEAARHLFRVSSGLDSMILGESQILGQVRGALTAASDSNSLKTPVSRLFHRAIRTGRRVREETDLGRNALSISFAAVQLCERVLRTLGGARVLLIGAGEAGQLVARALRTTGAGELVIANRTLERGQDVARELGGTAAPLSEIDQLLRDADIAIAATETPEYVLTAEAVQAAAEKRGDRSLLLFDLGVPRNIEPETADLENVSLFNIDDLSSIAEENLKERENAAGEAEQIVEDEVSRFMAWWDSLHAVPLIKELRAHADQIRTEELEKALRKVAELSSEDIEALDAMTRSIINRLLHNPTISLKQGNGDGQIHAARELFRLWGESR